MQHGVGAVPLLSRQWKKMLLCVAGEWRTHWSSCLMITHCRLALRSAMNLQCLVHLRFPYVISFLWYLPLHSLEMLKLLVLFVILPLSSISQKLIHRFSWNFEKGYLVDHEHLIHSGMVPQNWGYMPIYVLLPWAELKLLNILSDNGVTEFCYHMRVLDDVDGLTNCWGGIWKSIKKNHCYRDCQEVSFSSDLPKPPMPIWWHK